MCLPLGTYRNANLSGPGLLSAAIDRGNIASSIGSAMAVPRPRKIVRRESGLPKIRTAETPLIGIV